MPFWPRRRPSTREQQWGEFATRLELEDAGSEGERLRRWLDLADGRVGPLYVLRREGQPSLYLFDVAFVRRGPAGSARHLRSVVLLRAHGPVTEHSWRALPRRNEVLESLEASRTGSARVAWPDDEAFDGEVSVFARDAAEVRGLLQRPLRAVLRRTLGARQAQPTLVVGKRHLMLSVDGAAPAPLETLEALAADALTLYALIAPADH
jgi:hypothetical protein